MIDTVHGAKASAMIYNLVETAKANNLKPHEYLKHLLTEIPRHMDDTSTAFLDALLSWSLAVAAVLQKIESTIRTTPPPNTGGGVLHFKAPMIYRLPGIWG